MKQKAKEFGLLNLGILLLAVGVYFFKFPNHFTTGGVSGISIIFGKLISFLTPATMMFLVNGILLVVGFWFVGKSFGVKTVYASLMFSLETFLFELLLPMETPFTDQPLLELLFAIALPAIGSAILFNLNASSGGTDIIAMILKKYTHINIGTSLLITDIVIAASAFFVFDMKTGLFSIFGLTLKAFIIDSVIENINLCKYFTIVTTKPKEVCDFVINDLKHTATLLKGTGVYSSSETNIILVACRRGEALRLKREVKKIDVNSFMFITNTSEIIGKGFRTIDAN